MATCSSSLAWKIPRTEEPRGYSPWGPKIAGHDSTDAHLSVYYPSLLQGKDLSSWLYAVMCSLKYCLLGTYYVLGYTKLPLQWLGVWN